MKTLLVGINAKYIHPNLAIRYLKANSDFDIDLIEFSIKDDLNYIINKIIEYSPMIVGFSVYIWNVNLIKEILLELSKTEHQMKIILGGPEVSYDSEDFLRDYSVDFIIRNEGENAFNQLLHAIKANQEYSKIPNLIYLSNDEIFYTQTQEIHHLNKLFDPYTLPLDDYQHQIAYVELSRGCPYKCAYCLASLEKRVRFFEVDRVKKQLVRLYESGSRTFKFLDRTFNAREDIAKDLLNFIFENNFPEAVFQFEITADILSEDFICFINENCPVNKIRFEIGIQSTNPQVNEAVDRKQNNEKLIRNIKLLKQGNVTMHLDLIAGLPYEDLISFKKTFDTVFKLYGDELQLGFLKLLKGTKIYHQRSLHDYRMTIEAPYELVDNRYIKDYELAEIHLVEAALNIYWNKNFMNEAIIKITEELDSPFDFFLELAKYLIDQHFDFHRYQLSTIFQLLEEFINEKKYIYDIRWNYLAYHKIKPKIYWDKTKKKNEIVRLFHSQNPEYNIDELYKYAVVTNYEEDYILAIYYPTKAEIHKVKA